MISEKTRDGFVVLIVDDDELDRFVIARSFKALCDDLELIEVSDSTTAVDAIQTHQPDLTLLDLQMPGMTGIDVLEALSSDASQSNAPRPILMLSSSTRTIDRDQAIQKGATAYHVKPATMNGFKELAEHVRSTYLM